MLNCTMKAAFVGTPVVPLGGLVSVADPVVELLVRPVVNWLWNTCVIWIPDAPRTP